MLALFKELKIRDIPRFLLLALTFLPGKLLKLFKSHIWLVTEAPENARDNGYWMFRYLREHRTGIIAYYPIRKKSSDYVKVKDMGNVIEFGGLKHYILFWACEKYLGTTKEHGFPDERTCLFLELRNLTGFKYVFLNHGVARGYSGIVDAGKTNYDMVIAISEAEKRIMVKYNSQKPENVYPLGFCRHDNLNDDLLDKKMILFMPTWRNYLDSRHETDRRTIKEITGRFLKSDYYKMCKKIISDSSMLEFLERNDLHMVFYLHGYAQGYAKYFKSPSDRVKVAYKEDYFVQDLLKQAAFLITDYSSVIFDFAYMKKPCLYFQYDKELFEENQYSESEDYSYEEDGFGPVCYTYEAVLQYLEQSCRKEFVMEEQYAKRVEEYFPSFDNQHCKRIVKAIKSH